MKTQSAFQHKENVNSTNTGAARLIGVLMFIVLFAAPVSYVNAETDYERYCSGTSPIIVTTFDDDPEDGMGCTADHCTLREAIDAANQCTGDTRVAVYLEAGTYTLTRFAVDPFEGNDISGLVIHGNVFIVGDNSTITRKSEDPFRIFHISRDASLTASDVSIEGGDVFHHIEGTNYGGDGGGIFVEETGKLDLLRSRVGGNAAWHGGGIYNEGEVKLRETKIMLNYAVYDGGGIHVSFSRAKAFVHQSSVVNNFSGGAGGIYNHGGVLIVKSSTIAGNNGGYGGGLKTTDGKLILTDSTIYKNVSNHSIPDNNPSTRYQRNGGGLVLLSNARITNTVIADNAPLNCSGEWDKEDPRITKNFTSNGISMTDDVSCAFHPAFAGGVVSTAMLDDATAPNFYTVYFQPLPGSPLIDSGETCQSYDQRRKIRPVDGDGDGVRVCDVGAVEYRDDYAEYKQDALSGYCPPGFEYVCGNTSPKN